MATTIHEQTLLRFEIPPDDWEKTPESVRRALRRLWEEKAALDEKSRTSSRNSSTPPSKDRLQHKKPRRKQATGRKPGGQRGHRGVTRPLVPPAQLSTPPIVVTPSACPCGHVFAADAPTTGAPWRHQVFELPPIPPLITEYQLAHCPCPDCGATIRADRPAGVPALTLGPRAQALITLLTGQYHLAKRAVATLLRDLYGLPLSAASVCAVEQAMSAVLAEPVAAVQAAVQQAPVKHLDESGWPQRRDPDPDQPATTPLKRGWLWSATTPDATVYLIRRSRAQAVAKELLGVAATATDYDTVVVTDRHGAYNWLPLSARQLCWAHLDRDFLAVSERSDPIAQRLGQELLAQTDRLFAAWRQYQDGTLTFAALGATLQPVRAAIAASLREGHTADPKTKTVCANLLKLEPALWTFLRVEGVAPTNNVAERSQRRGVMKRDRTLGTQTSAGSRYVERILTTIATCRQQGTNALTYLTEALVATLHDAPLPALITI
ncbi:MAG TPA: IS66 family transposase [Armatimonadota bacterium]